MLKRLLLSLGFFLFLFSSVGHAQTISAIVVASCGTPPGTYTAGQPFALNIDTTGKLCTSGSGGGSGGAVYGPTAAGTAAANPPVLVGGTVDGTATGAVDNLKVAGGLAYVNCSNCTGSGASGADEGAFIAGTSNFAPGGGFYQTTATSNPLTTGQWGTWQVTAYRAGMVNLRNASGVEIGTATTPLVAAGPAAAGAALSGNPLLVGGSDGTDIRDILTDTSGREIEVGAAATGAALAGNPVLIAGSDGTDARNLSTDTSGHLIIEPGNTANTTAWLVTGTGGTFPATESGTWTVQPGNTANTTPWLTSIAQGGNTVGVTAASTAAVATQPSLVMQLNPTSPGIIATSAPGTAPASGNTIQTQGAVGGISTPVVNVGTGNLAVAQVSVANTATSIVAARTGVQGTGRKTVCITNTSTVAVYIGGSGVTTSTGSYLPGVAGSSICLDTQAAVYGIVATGTETVSEIETY
jgi:hypothetical protein